MMPNLALVPLLSGQAAATTAILPVRRRGLATQPQYKPRINPVYADRITHLVHFPSMSDLVTGTFSNGISTAVRFVDVRGGPFGSGYCSHDVNGYGLLLNGSLAKGSGQLTVFAAIQYLGATGGQHQTLISNMGDYGAQGTDFAIDGTSGALRLSVTNGDYGDIYTAVSDESLSSDSKLQVVAASWIGSANLWRFSINGKTVGYTGGASSPSVASESYETTRVGSNNSGSGGWGAYKNGRIYTVGSWKRAFSQPELNALTSAPWSVFAPPHPVWLASGAAASLYPTLSLAELINLLQTQATPRVYVDVP